ncbi:hypothetical protein P9112_003814 [Eukaryota sp. TZLM1-RC]
MCLQPDILLLLQGILEHAPHLYSQLFAHLNQENRLSSSNDPETYKQHLQWLCSTLPNHLLSSITSHITPSPSPFVLPSFLPTPSPTYPNSNHTPSFFSSSLISYELDLSSSLHSSPHLSLTQYFDGHTETIHCCLFDHTSRLLVTGSEDKLVKIWDTSLGILRSSLRVSQHPITDLAISQDNLLLACADTMGGIFIFHLHNSIVAFTTEQLGFNITLIKFIVLEIGGVKWRVLVAASEDGSIRFFCLGRINQKIDCRHSTVSPFRKFQHMVIHRPGRQKNVVRGVTSLVIFSTNSAMITAGHNGSLAFWPLHVSSDDSDLIYDPLFVYNDPKERYIVSLVLSNDESLFVVVYKDLSIDCFTTGVCSDLGHKCSWSREVNGKSLFSIEGKFHPSNNSFVLLFGQSNGIDGSYDAYVAVLTFLDDDVISHVFQVDSGIFGEAPCFEFFPFDSSYIIVGSCRHKVSLFSLQGEIFTSITVDSTDPLPINFCQSATSFDGKSVAFAGFQTIAIFNTTLNERKPLGAAFLEQFTILDPYYRELQRQIPPYFVSDSGYFAPHPQNPALCNIRFEPYKDNVPRLYEFPPNIDSFCPFLEGDDVTVSNGPDDDVIRSKIKCFEFEVLYSSPFWARNSNNKFCLVAHKYSISSRISLTKNVFISQQTGLPTEKQVIIEPPPPPSPEPFNQPINHNLIDDVIDDVPDDAIQEEDFPEFIPDDDGNDDDFEVSDAVATEAEDDDYGEANFLTTVELVEQNLARRRSVKEEELPSKRKRRQLNTTLSDEFMLVDRGQRHAYVAVNESQEVDESQESRVDSDSDDEFLNDILTPAQREVQKSKENAKKQPQSKPQSKKIELPSLQTLSLTSRESWQNSFDNGYVPQVGDSVVFVPKIYDFVVESVKITLIKSLIARLEGEKLSNFQLKNKIFEYFDFLNTMIPNNRMKESESLIKGRITFIDFESLNDHYPEECLPLCQATIGIATDYALPIEAPIPPKSTVEKSQNRSRLRSQSSVTNRTLPVDHRVNPYEGLLLEAEYEIQTVFAPPFPFLLPLGCEPLLFSDLDEFKAGDSVFVNRTSGLPIITGTEVYEFRQFLTHNDVTLPDWLKSEGQKEFSKPLAPFLGSLVCKSVGNKLSRRREARIVSINQLHHLPFETNFCSITVELKSPTMTNIQLVVSPWDLIPSKANSKQIFCPFDIGNSLTVLNSTFFNFAFNIISQIMEESPEFSLFQEIPVDRIAPGYSSIVPIASSASFLIQNLHDGLYRHPGALLFDIERILSNAELFNGVDDFDIVPFAKKFVSRLKSELFKWE